MSLRCGNLLAVCWKGAVWELGVSEFAFQQGAKELPTGGLQGHASPVEFLKIETEKPASQAGVLVPN